MIPIFRAKHYRDDIYFMGSLIGKEDEYYIVQDEDMEYRRPIDITTLAISFDDMLDGQGNKIFASLSEDGKGGDILYYEDDCQPYICEHSSDGTFLFEYLDNKTIKNYICRLSQEKVLFEDLKIIGIQ